MHAYGGVNDRFSDGTRTMQNVVTVPLSATWSSSSVGTAQRGQAPRDGT